MSESKVNKWTREELRELVEIYPTTEASDLVAKYKRSYRAIVSKASRLKVRKDKAFISEKNKISAVRGVGTMPIRGKKWDPEKLSLMLAEYPHTDSTLLAEKYNVSRAAITGTAGRYGVAKTKEFKLMLAQRAGLLGTKSRWGDKRDA